jgi:hypothetical protein
MNFQIYSVPRSNTQSNRDHQHEKRCLKLISIDSISDVWTSKIKILYNCEKFRINISLTFLLNIFKINLFIKFQKDYVLMTNVQNTMSHDRVHLYTDHDRMYTPE